MKKASLNKKPLPLKREIPKGNTQAILLLSKISQNFNLIFNCF